MIINTGARTDTVQYYTKWLLKRFEEKYVLVRNPLFPNKVTRYELTPEKVDAVIFCSKNYAPVLPYMDKITDKFNAYFFYTITAYSKDIEPNVPSIEESIETLIRLSKIVGKQRIAWRYDPVLLTEKYTIENHINTFNYMMQKLHPYIDRCIFSFVEMYKKLEQNMPELILLTEDDKQILAQNFGNVSKQYNICIQTCGTKEDYSKFGINKSGCMTLDILRKANGLKFKKLKHKGMRQNCNCIESRDIGAYDTCPNGCRYCYANKNPKLAFENYKFHNPASPLLFGEIKEGDIVQQGVQNTFLENQIPLKFDL